MKPTMYITVLKIAPALKGKRHFIAMVVLLSMDVVCVLFFILLVLIFNGKAFLIITVIL